MSQTPKVPPETRLILSALLVYLSTCFPSDVAFGQDAARLEELHRILSENSSGKEYSVEVRKLVDNLRTLDEMSNPNQCYQLEPGGNVVCALAPRPTPTEPDIYTIEEAKQNIQNIQDIAQSAYPQQFSTASFQCLKDRRACDHFGYQWLDCELTMLTCLLTLLAGK